MKHTPELTSLEICAGAGGQALGIEQAGFNHLCAIELDTAAHATLLANRKNWNPELANVREVRGTRFKGVDLFAGGVPCPPFSVAGRQLGADDDRDLFPAALEWIKECEPKAVLLENVPGLATAKFAPYRQQLFDGLRQLGFSLVTGKVLNASDYGVCQLRPRFLIVALKSPYSEYFEWPKQRRCRKTVGELLYPMMKENGWRGALKWSERAAGIAPTLVGGSKLHGGPDLGPTRAKKAWRELGVDGNGIADAAPAADAPVSHVPKLTVPMTAKIQGFPKNWKFSGRKTASYRQIGNAFPPPVAKAVGRAIRSALLQIPPSRSQGWLLAKEDE